MQRPRIVIDAKPELIDAIKALAKSKHYSVRVLILVAVAKEYPELQKQIYDMI